MARFTFSVGLSNAYSGVYTPTTTRPLSLYFSCQLSTWGSVLRQLTQSKVQKSTSTTWPCSLAIDSGSELSQVSMPWNSGAGCSPWAACGEGAANARNAARAAAPAAMETRVDRVLMGSPCEG